MEEFETVGQLWAALTDASEVPGETFDGHSGAELWPMQAGQPDYINVDVDGQEVTVTAGEAVGKVVMSGVSVSERVLEACGSLGIRRALQQHNEGMATTHSVWTASLILLLQGIGASVYPTAGVVGSGSTWSEDGVTWFWRSGLVNAEAPGESPIAMITPALTPVSGYPTVDVEQWERWRDAWERPSPALVYLESSDIAAIHDAAETISAESALALTDHKGRAIVAGGPGEAIELPPREPSVGNALTRLAQALSSVTGAREYSTDAFDATANIVRTRGKK
jgi:hypothetical protein